MDEDEVRARPFAFYKSAVEQFAERLERVRGSDLRDAAESRQVLQNSSSSSPQWRGCPPPRNGRFARVAMESCAGQFRKAGHVVAMEEDE